jgi:serine protease inhibitor
VATYGIPEEQVKVNVDRPFLFAVVHRPSAACLFLGRVNDPRPSGNEAIK